ncbi:hypothetical protein DL765_007097 [Monosporascus sp. GIB2]|nr:hypothetical protein DL765_007097 [Monosporascus sp. GIB2]
MATLFNRLGSARRDDDFIQKLNAGEYNTKLVQLYPDPKTPWQKPPTFQADIVLVAGLGGHPIETWQHEATAKSKTKSKTLWPRDLLPGHIRDIRVWSFNYNCTIKGSASIGGIRDHANSLLRELFNKEKEEEVNKAPTPIVFVGHSLGGLVIKQALYQASKDGNYKRIWEASRGVDDDSKGGNFAVVREGIVSLINQTPKAIDRIDRHGKKVLYALCSDEFHLQPMARKPDAGTCGWIQDKPEIQNFLNNVETSDKRNFWIFGPPACGKSYLARHIIKEYGSSGSQDVIYCFINRSVPGSTHVNAVLSSTMQQAIRLAPEVILPFLHHNETKPVQDGETRETRAESDVWSPEKIRSIWPTIMVQVTARVPIIGVIDGFDELEEECRQTFLACLKRTGNESHNSSNLRWLFLSRPISSPLTTESSGEIGFNTYDIKAKETDGDISKSIQAELDGVWATKGFVNMAAQQVIEDKIKEKSGGNYLSASLITEDIKRNRDITSEGDILTLLNSPGFPKDLPGTYDYIKDNISSKSSTMGAILEQALWWAAFQHEGLTPQEFNMAQAVGRALEQNPIAEGITSSELQPLLDDNIDMTLNLQCGHLVKFQGGRLELVHSSIREYLLMHKKEACYHARLANICITYLTMPHFEDSGPAPDAQRMSLWESKVRERVKEHKFARYAAVYWHDHLRDAGLFWPTSPGDEGRRRVLNDPKRGFSVSWVEVWWYYNMWPGQNFSHTAALKQIGIVHDTGSEIEVKDTGLPPSTANEARVQDEVLQDEQHDDNPAKPPSATKVAELPLDGPPAIDPENDKTIVCFSHDDPTQPTIRPSPEDSLADEPLSTNSSQHDAVIHTASPPEEDRIDSSENEDDTPSGPSMEFKNVDIGSSESRHGGPEQQGSNGSSTINSTRRKDEADEQNDTPFPSTSRPLQLPDVVPLTANPIFEVAKTIHPAVTRRPVEDHSKNTEPPATQQPTDKRKESKAVVNFRESYWSRLRRSGGQLVKDVFTPP